ncbi:MAG: thioredoxin family protein [Deltaproteobacteria bacterium]|nr:thioredoxin family protein [Deltaproteobacteria bacterium]
MNKTIIAISVTVGILLIALGFWFLPEISVGNEGNNQELSAMPQKNSGIDTQDNLTSFIATLGTAAPTNNTFSPIPGVPDNLNLFSVEEAFGEDADKTKYIILYFWASWCPNCEVFNHAVLPKEEVIQELNTSFKLVPVDCDNDPLKLSVQFRVRAVPTFIFLSPDLEPATVLPGSAPPAVFLQVLKYVSSGSYLNMTFSDFAEMS